eukprot:CAMPEP_0181303770 /NCGR_PEP_ID=MMETSP1101-20121128/8749_1 /TAXON_ID=46948 /ORGANISM="Rhodomonas abbreviata, Strain Caron Lab Isolate" /LENGTH=99 /DNA_ID=CAMNT_0023409393 /DNA_START=51 /DNA_END=350 /DNA_ORIENTATION=-
MLHGIVPLFALAGGNSDAIASPDFNGAGYNTVGIRSWNFHGPDWIYQGGPSTDTRRDVFYNQWDDADNLNTATHGWAVPTEVDPNSVDPWMSAIGGGIY